MPGFSTDDFNNNRYISVIDNIISFGYYNLNVDPNQIENLKKNFRSFIMQYKWSERIQFNVNLSDHWVFVNIKLK
jgi:hypothetical protein